MKTSYNKIIGGFQTADRQKYESFLFSLTRREKYSFLNKCKKDKPLFQTPVLSFMDDLVIYDEFNLKGKCFSRLGRWYYLPRSFKMPKSARLQEFCGSSDGWFSLLDMDIY
jgi:hypothetical protein